MKKILFLLLGIIVIISIAYFGIKNYSGSSKAEPTKELSDNLNNNFQGSDKLNTKSPDIRENTSLTKYQLKALLKDVSGGVSSGEVMAGYIDGEYMMIASFKDLPEPNGTDFYEGWVVRKSPLSVISTGVALKNEDGLYINNFTSNEDLSDHNLYVLTLEPDDGDPAPDVHILEGEFKSI